MRPFFLDKFTTKLLINNEEYFVKISITNKIKMNLALLTATTGIGLLFTIVVMLFSINFLKILQSKCYQFLTNVVGVVWQ